MNIAIFGGSFDPPHSGHLNIILNSIKILEIDMLYVLVSFLNPFKTESRSNALLRLFWMRKITQNLKNVSCSDFEIKQNRPVKSIESVRHFKNILNPKKIYFIIGEDNLYKIRTWDNFYELNNLVTFVVFERRGFNKNDISDLNIMFIPFNYNISSSNIINNLNTFIDFIPKSVRFLVAKSIKEGKMMFSTEIDLNNKIEEIIKTLDSKNAKDIQVIDLENKDYTWSFVVLATSMVGKHGLALLEYLKENLKHKNISILRIDSENEDWVILDLGEIVVHIFTEQYREKYNLEDFLKELPNRFK